MYYGEIKNCDIANGVGVRISLFVSGCTNKCKGCFQPETWPFDYGEEFTIDTENTIINLLSPDYIDGLTVLGGEPFEPKNQEAIYQFLQRVKEELPEKSIWIFTGFTIEEILQTGSYCNTAISNKILELADVLVDGRFEEGKKDISLKFRGSSNQRVIDLNKTTVPENIILWEEQRHKKPEVTF